MTPAPATEDHPPRFSPPRLPTALILALAVVLAITLVLAGRGPGGEPAPPTPRVGLLAATDAGVAGGTTTNPGGGGTADAGTTVASAAAATGSRAASSGAGDSGRTSTAELSRVAAGLVDVDTLTDNAQLLGTGMIVRADGLVLTNHHVIDHATQIRVRDLGDHRVYSATIAAVNTTHDLALLRLQNAASLTVATFGDSRTVKIGDPITALGNAGGGNANPIAATGTVTALNQAVDAGGDDGTTEPLTGMIQGNSPAAPGDSGGPMINSAGQIIGVTTAGSTVNATGGNQEPAGSGAAACGAVVDATPINIARAWAAQAIAPSAPRARKSSAQH
jgi:S1-C subfamily serine protease